MVKRFLLLIVILALLPAVSFGDTNDTLEIWVSSDGEKSADAIAWHREKDGYYYLYIPGIVDPGSLKIGWNVSKALTINGTETRSGDSAAVLQADNEVVYNRKTFRLKVMTGSPELPVLYIATKSGRVAKIHESKKNREAGTLLLITGKGKTEYDGPLEYIKIRGNVTTTYDKKSYQLKLETGTNLLKMGKAKKWILRANYIDKSLIREQFTFDLARYAGMSYVPEHRQCEVYINHRYYGLYLLTEKIEIDDDRVDLNDLEAATKELNATALKKLPSGGPATAKEGEYKYTVIPNDPEDITGGYIIEYESSKRSRYADAESAYYTKRKNVFVIKDPEYASKSQMEYISGILQEMEDALFGENGNSKKTGRHYTDIIDLDSFVIKYIINELAKNYDANHTSEYLYKPEDGKSTKLFAGPVWDLDNCYANYARANTYKQILPPDTFFVNNAIGFPYLYPALYKQEDFRTRVKELYRSIFIPAIEILLGERKDPSGTLKSLEEYTDVIRESLEMNYVRYPNIELYYADTGNTVEENIAYIRNFLTLRREFLNSQWLDPAPEETPQ